MNLRSRRNVDRTRGDVIPEPRWNQLRDPQNNFETFRLLENLIELAILDVTSAGTAIFLSERTSPSALLQN
jgi:hypothetical protein